VKYWLVKTEPESYSIDDLVRDRKTEWTAVRNYQARNFLKEMAIGDLVLFYHSNAEPTGVVGIAEVSRTAQPDPTQFDSKSEYFDPKATKDAPRWFCPTLKFIEKFKGVIVLDKLRTINGLEGMILLKKGSRLSVQPVSAGEYRILLKLATLT